MTPTLILMSPQNPTGWKLEELLAAVRSEIEGKCDRIRGDTRPVAERVLSNNLHIMALLGEAERVQRDSMAALAAVGPDQGPLGKPRIGKGSDPAVIQSERQTR